MNLEALKIVQLVARHGGFAAAARVLDLDPSSVSRTVANVEVELGVRLFQRSTRNFSMTEQGADYVARIAPLLEALEGAGNAVRNTSASPGGLLRLTSSVSFAQTCIVPHLGAFTGQYPGIEIELLTTDANIDLVAEGVDLAVRLTPEPVGDLIRTKLKSTRYVVCASPEYITSHDQMTRPCDLEHHDCLRFTLPGYRDRWRFKTHAGDVFEVPVNGKIVASNALSLRDAASNGLGPALLPDWLVGADLQKGRLVDVFPAFEATATSFDTAAWALYPSRSYLPQKVRVMIDFLRRVLA